MEEEEQALVNDIAELSKEFTTKDTDTESNLSPNALNNTNKKETTNKNYDQFTLLTTALLSYGYVRNIFKTTDKNKNFPFEIMKICHTFIGDANLRLNQN